MPPPKWGTPERWMAEVDGSVLLSAISIPGTHDSASRRGAIKAGLARVGGDYACTHFEGDTILAQLQMGIRFFDFRIETGGKLRHGIAELEGNYYDMLKTIAEFLDQHPSECVCVSAKWEKEDASGNQPEPDSEADWVIAQMKHIVGHHRFWWKNHIPKLDEARGKIVYLTRFSGRTPDGIRYNPASRADEDAHSGARYKCQDYFDLTGDYAKGSSKIKFENYVKLFLEEAVDTARRGYQNIWYFNFTSGLALSWYDLKRVTPHMMAHGYSDEYKSYNFGVNTSIQRFLQGAPTAFRTGRLGTVIMDYVQPPLVKLIYSNNPWYATKWYQ